MFSVPLLRSHATVSLVDRHRLQLYHANHSVILVSSAINFSGGDGLEKFIATIIAFRHLSPEQNGILATLFSKNTDLVKNRNIVADDKVVQEGNVVVFSGSNDEDFAVKVGEIISRDPAVVGRSTAVVDAASNKWLGTELVMKVSWPGSGRVPESDFLKKACAEAEMTEGKWATKHLPRMLDARDVAFEPGSTLDLVAELFRNPTFAGGKKFQYERRTLRVIIQERLYSIKALTNVRDIGQVFLDVACSTCVPLSPRFPCAYTCSVHRWLFDKPGILHRDLSFNNIMCRIIKELGGKDKVYGVLTDYDLSSWAASLKTDYTKTAQQRTGTPPYMAQELLKGTSDTHLYRHDVESLFYTMLLTCARHKFDGSNKAKWSLVMREGELPYRNWFNQQDYDMLGSAKVAFFSGMEPIILSPAFEDFRGWLKDIQFCFSEGFKFKPLPAKEGLARWLPGGLAGGANSTNVQFDDETLGGFITYSTLIEPTRYLDGELRGLDIRYDPGSPPLSTPAGGVQVGP